MGNKTSKEQTQQTLLRCLTKFQKDTGQVISDKELTKAARSIKVQDYEANTEVVSKGDSPKGIFLILEGSVHVKSGDGDEILASLDTGQYFGEISVLFHVDCTATVETNSKCVLAHLDLGSAHQLVYDMKEDPIDWFVKMRYIPTSDDFDVKRTVRRLVYNCMSQVSMFEQWDEAALKRLILKLHPGMIIIYPQNSTVMCVDDPPVAVYIIIRGSAVIKDSANEEIVSITQEGPTVLGEEGVLLDDNSKVTVRTTTCCEVILIRLEWILDVINKYPQAGQVWEKRKSEWKAHKDRKEGVPGRYTSYLQFEVLSQFLRNNPVFSKCSASCIEFMALHSSADEYQEQDLVCTQDENEDISIILVLFGELELLMTSDEEESYMITAGEVFCSGEWEKKWEKVVARRKSLLMTITSSVVKDALDVYRNSALTFRQIKLYGVYDSSVLL